MLGGWALGWGLEVGSHPSEASVWPEPSVLNERHFSGNKGRVKIAG